MSNIALPNDLKMFKILLYKKLKRKALGSSLQSELSPELPVTPFTPGIGRYTHKCSVLNLGYFSIIDILL